MKKIISKPLIVLTIFSVFILSLSACNGGNKSKLVNKWKMMNEDVVVDFKKDGTYTFAEAGTVTNGTWAISEDGNTVTLTEAGSGVKSLTIKEAGDDKLVLSDNGDDWVFEDAD